MSHRAVQWIAIGLLALLLVGLVGWVHGRTHYRGDEVGDHGDPVTTVIQIVP
jgi:hypothetical protein